MDEATETKIAEYLEIVERVGAAVKDATIVASVIDQIGKDRRCSWMMDAEGSAVVEQRDSPATEKQLGFLKSLGARDIPDGLSKSEASRMIEELQGRS